MLTKKEFALPAVFAALLGICSATVSAQSMENATGANTGASSMTGGGSSGTGAVSPTVGQSGNTKGAKDTIPMVVLVPFESKPEATLYNGCWVRLLDNVEKPAGKEFLTIVGRMYLPAMNTASGVDWSGKADGIDIGPNAILTAFGQKGYQGPGIVLKPGQIVQDVQKDLGFVNSIESLTIECKS